MAEEELEQFRRQWQQEVSTRNRGSIASPSPHASSSRDRPVRAASVSAVEPKHRPEDDHLPGWNFDDLEEREAARKLGESGSGVHPESRSSQEPQSALEHYERAVERETQGKLGDSLVYYRKAFRLDDSVDKKYKNKHFPPSSFPPKTPPGAASTSASTATATHPHASHASTSPPTRDLASSFAGIPLLGARPQIERDIPPPCPIASAPQEILNEILLTTALLDVASFARLSLVCKRFAYLIVTEDSIWKRVVHGPEFGFQGMHFNFAVSISGRPLISSQSELPDLSTLSLTTDSAARTLAPTPRIPLTLPLTPAYPSYRQMHHTRPRLRFAGLYISTVNYVRPGAASPTAVTWHSPVHVVTYYRYLRFFRTGEVLSLLSTAEPVEVVPHLRRENVGLGQGGIASHGGGPGITAVARNTLVGRWRISKPEEMQRLEKPTDVEGEQDEVERPEVIEPEGHVYIETKGPKPEYKYNMQLALRSAGGGDRARNTKLVWTAFWSYNKITDDWVEFPLKNNRAYAWSRVRSWADA